MSYNMIVSSKGLFYPTWVKIETFDDKKEAELNLKIELNHRLVMLYFNKYDKYSLGQDRLARLFWKELSRTFPSMIEKISKRGKKKKKGFEELYTNENWLFVFTLREMQSIAHHYTGAIGEIRMTSHQLNLEF